ncbi:MAG: 4'-phosphopantetheinyl transferase superfamily protein [Oscillospiraceae bacterium]|nr:4'-phosphopantetheinyl transferase superfamily protein [Oscillospiraceae bacterium]
MVQLYELDLAKVSDEMLAQWHAEMDESSRGRVGAMSAKRCRESLAGDHLARTALAKKSGKAPQDIVIRREKSGKPTADEGYFSISHSGSLVVCAVSDKPVGVDVECIRKPLLRVAQRYFTEEEKKLLQEDDSQFWRVWTGKEALCKLSGEGLAGLKHADTLAPPVGVTLTTVRRDGYVITAAEQNE